MKALSYIVAGLLGIALVACNHREATEIPDANKPEVKRDIVEYQKVLQGKWVHDMPYMQKQSVQIRKSIMEAAKSKNRVELSGEFHAALNSLMEKTEQGWSEWQAHFFFDQTNRFKVRVKNRNYPDPVVFNVACGVDPFDISFSVPDTADGLSWSVASLKDPHLYKDALVWSEVKPIPGTDRDLTIIHRCIRADQ